MAVERHQIEGDVMFSSRAAQVDLRPLLKRQGRVVLDYSGVNNVDSVCVAKMIQLKREADHNQCELAFENLPSRLKDLIHLYGLDRTLLGLSSELAKGDTKGG